MSGSKALLSGVIGVAVVAALMTPLTTSFYYDLERMEMSAEAGEWLAIPAECDAVLKHPHTSVIEGTQGDDVLPAPGGSASPGGDDNKPNFGQVILGYAGNDVLTGGNQHDCLVGGSGHDLLIGGNGKDILIGGDGIDECRGGNGPEVVYIGCETIVRGNGNDGGNGNGKDKDKFATSTTQQTPVAPAPETIEPDSTTPEPETQEPTTPEPSVSEPTTDPTEAPEPTDEVEAPTDTTESAGDL